MLKIYPLYKHMHKQNIVNLLEYVLYNYLGELLNNIATTAAAANKAVRWTEQMWHNNIKQFHTLFRIYLEQLLYPHLGSVCHNLQTLGGLWVKLRYMCYFTHFKFCSWIITIAYISALNNDISSFHIEGLFVRKLNSWNYTQNNDRKALNW